MLNAWQNQDLIWALYYARSPFCPCFEFKCTEFQVASAKLSTVYSPFPKANSQGTENDSPIPNSEHNGLIL